MIGDRHVFVVGHQRIVGPEQPARIGGVKDRGEEIGEVADPDRKQQFGIFDRRQVGLDRRAPLRRSRAQQPRQFGAQRGPGRGATLHQRVEMRRRAGGRGARGHAVHEIGDRRDVENFRADGDADAWRRIVPAPPEHRIGQILDREIAVRHIGARDEAAQSGIMGFVQCHCHTWNSSGRAWNSLPGAHRGGVCTNSVSCAAVSGSRRNFSLTASRSVPGRSAILSVCSTSFG